jgi:hypothetical protein
VAAFAEPLSIVPHGGEDEDQFLSVVRAGSEFGGALHHQDLIGVGEGGMVCV